MKKIFCIALLLPMAVMGQNYIKTTTYKVPTSLNPSPSDAEKAISITYLDGLGRPIQQVAHRQSGTGTDLVTHIEYDDFGRQAREYLPYANATPSEQYNPSARGETEGFYDSPYFGNTLNPYAKKRFEASPLNRVLEQAAPGNDWDLDNSHTIKLDYQTNADGEVKFYKAQANASTLEGDGYYQISLLDNGYYPAEQLYKTITKDENCTLETPYGGVTEEFKDKEGRVVLKRTYGESIINLTGGIYTAHDTYYVYDQYGNLSYVIPPLVTNALEQLDGLCYQYRYDYRNRMVEKKLPGRQWEYMVYDKLDRLAATSRNSSPFSDVTSTGWVFTKYDTFDRPVLTGWFNGEINTQQRKSLQDHYMLSTSLTHETRSTTDSYQNAVSYRYTNVAYPTSDFGLLTVNYYDDYAIPGAPSLPASIEGQPVLANTRGLATSSWTRVLEGRNDGKAQVSFTFYDEKSRPIRSLARNYLGGYTQVDRKLDFTGKERYTITTHKRTNTDTELKVQDNYWYTEQDRLLLHFQDINDNQHQLIARNEYDELGRLTVKHVGGDVIDETAEGLQKVDYTYNIRGWLTGINNTDDLADTPADLFAFRIDYNTTTGEVPGIVPLYNGNIAQTFWRSASDDVLRKYGYRYDDLNRLREAIYQKPNSDVKVTNSYNESMDYDKNGNIVSLSRNGDLDDQSNLIEIDHLKYSYDSSNRNRLMRVEDSSEDSSGFKDDEPSTGEDDYSYDANGNMTYDWNKDIQQISYNHMDLPASILFHNATTKKIDYLYDASGRKLAKTVTIGAQEFKDDYLDGFQYINGSLSFFPTDEGYVRNTIVDYENHFNYVFNYTDHLGNIRMSYGIDPSTNVLKIMEENHYYPFGLKHAKYNTTIKDFGKQPDSNNIALKQIIDPGDKPLDEAHFGTYQYKYNGKEYQDELGLNLYDYGARNYDPAIGRWMNMDKFSEIYTGITPYSYAIDNPVLFIDPDGNYIDDAWIYAKHDGKQNKALIAAWETFAKSKEGIAFLTNFAEAGQNIAGIKYEKSGKFDKNNHDLNFGLNTQGASQTDTHAKKDGGMQTTLLLSDSGYKEDMNLVEIAHESFVHAEKDGEDYLDDKKLNLSNLDKDVVKHTDNDIKRGYWPAYRTSSAQHYQEKKDQTLNKQLLPMLKQLYKRDGVKKDENATKKMINGYTQ